jgi:uncharacterized phage protein (TIGR02216 family)
MMGPTRFDWPGLMQAGLFRLGLTPAEFWALTPAEFLILLGHGAAARPLGRQQFEALAARFPDQRPKAEAQDG